MRTAETSWVGSYTGLFCQLRVLHVDDTALAISVQNEQGFPLLIISYFQSSDAWHRYVLNHNLLLPSKIITCLTKVE